MPLYSLTPAPTASPDSLLYCIQLARHISLHSGYDIRARRKCYELADRFKDVLELTKVSPHHIGFVKVCESPWTALEHWTMVACGIIDNEKPKAATVKLQDAAKRRHIRKFKSTRPR